MKKAAPPKKCSPYYRAIMILFAFGKEEISLSVMTISTSLATNGDPMARVFEVRIY